MWKEKIIFALMILYVVCGLIYGFPTMREL